MSTPASSIVEKKPSRGKARSKVDMAKKMLADQKLIREAIQNGTTFQELREQHGFKFATI